MRSSGTWWRCAGVFSTLCEASSLGKSLGFRSHVYRSSGTWWRCAGGFSTRCEASSSGNSQGLRIHVYRSGLSLEYAFGSGFRRSSNTHGSGSRLFVKAVVSISKLCTNASFAESTIFSNSAVLMYLQKTNARRHFLLIFADFLLSRSRSIVRI